MLTLPDGLFESAQSEPSGETATWLDSPVTSVQFNVPTDCGVTVFGAFFIALGGRIGVCRSGTAVNDAGDCEAGYICDISAAEGAESPIAGTRLCPAGWVASRRLPLHPAKIATANAEKRTREYERGIRSTPFAAKNVDTLRRQPHRRAYSTRVSVAQRKAA